jgi:hypothetical protein
MYFVIDNEITGVHFSTPIQSHQFQGCRLIPAALFVVMSAVIK